MELKSVHIRRYSRGEKFKSEIELFGDHGQITLNVTEEQARQIVAVCADSLVRSAKEAARLMTVDIINAVAGEGPNKALGAPKK